MVRLMSVLICLSLLFACTANNKIAVKQVEEINTRLSRLERIVDENSKKIDSLYQQNAKSGSIKLNKKIENLNQQLMLIKSDIQSLNSKAAVDMDNNQIKPKQQNGKAATNYKKGREYYKKRKYADSIIEFKNFIKDYPSHELIPNSHYWLAESHYALEEFIQAVNVFQKVVDFYPESQKAPDSQLKIGLCYKKMNKPEQAIIELKRINKMYPNYERKELVNKLLKELQ